jgi:hypothetical protein
MTAAVPNSTQDPPAASLPTVRYAESGAWVAPQEREQHLAR